MITSRNDFGEDVGNYDLPYPDPIALMMMWLPAHIDCYRPLMSLATIDQEGCPDLRHVLLSSYDQHGITFHVDQNSRKVQHLHQRPKAAASIAWPELARQLIIQGDVEQMPRQHSEAIYLQRNRYLQLLAWMNHHKNAQLSLLQRKIDWKTFANAHPEGSLAAPQWWVGYRIKPTRIAFWRGHPDSSSLRHDYQLKNGLWSVQILPG
jgi:pyridoxamine 5'-phosphate oxidase